MLNKEFINNLILTSAAIASGVGLTIIANKYLLEEGINMLVMFNAFGFSVLALSRYFFKHSFDGSRGAFISTLMWLVYSIIWRDPVYTVSAIWAKILHDVILFLLILFRINALFPFPKPYQKIKNCLVMLGFTLVATIPMDDNSITIISPANASIRTVCAILIFITCEMAKPFIIKTFKVWEECVMLLMGFLYFSSLYSVCLSILFLMIIMIKIYNNKEICLHMAKQFSAVTTQIKQFELIGEDDILIHGADLDTVPTKEEIAIINDDHAEQKDEHFVIMQNGYHEPIQEPDIEMPKGNNNMTESQGGFDLVYFDEDDYSNVDVFKALITPDDAVILEKMK